MLQSCATIMVVLSPLAVSAPPAFHDLVADDSPILWYQFNESAGSSTVANTGSLGAGFDASVQGAITLGTASGSGDLAAGFAAGGDPYVQSLADVPASMLGNPTFTIEAVVFIPSGGTSTLWAPILHWGTGATGHEVYFSLQHDHNNRFYVGFYNGGLRTAAPFQLDAWNHFVWTRDSNGGSNDAFTGSSLYINGQPVALEVDSDLPGFAGPPSIGVGPFRVQRGSDFVGTRHFDGTVDEVVLYSGLLSPTRIRAHADALAGPCSVADLSLPFGVLDFFDVQQFLQLFAAHDSRADLNHDSAHDFFDVQLFLQAFSAGCP